MLYQSLPATWEEAKPLLERILQENASTVGKVAGYRRRRPDPPRDLQVTVGTLDVTISWTAPVNPVDVAGWRVYKDTESNLIDKIADPSTTQVKIKLSISSPTAFYISSVNSIGQESIKIQAIGTPAQPNLGSLSGTVSLDTQVSDGVTYNRVTATPATGLNTGTAVDGSGNLKLKNINDASGTTSGPSTNGTGYVVVPEMTLTFTTKGNKVLLVFTCALGLFSSVDATPSGNLAFFRDGVQISADYLIESTQTANGSIAYTTLAGLSLIDSPTAASHTYTVQWKTTSANDNLKALGTGRRFQAIELG